MIWQRSVVAKEKVRTIEVNDYGCKKGIFFCFLFKFYM